MKLELQIFHKRNKTQHTSGINKRTKDNQTRKTIRLNNIKVRETILILILTVISRDKEQS